MIDIKLLPVQQPNVLTVTSLLIFCDNIKCGIPYMVDIYYLYSVLYNLDLQNGVKVTTIVLIFPLKVYNFIEVLTNS